MHHSLFIPVGDLKWKSKENSVAEFGNFTVASAEATKFHLDPAVFELSFWLLCTEHVMGQCRAGGGGGSHEVPGWHRGLEYKEEDGFGVSGEESDQDKLVRRLGVHFRVNISDSDNLQKQSLESLDFLFLFFYCVKICIHDIKFTILTILSVQFSGIKYIRIVVQLLPPSILIIHFIL